MSTAASSPVSKVWARLGYAGVLVALAGMLAFWSVLTPPLSTVDEPMHFNSVLRLIQGGGWPPPQSAPVLEGTFVAAQEAGNPFRGTASIETPEPADRSVVTDLVGDSYEGVTDIDWMTQHPPTYYGIVAGVLTAVGGAEWRWDQLALGMRLFSGVFVVGAFAFVLASLRRGTGSPAAAIVGGAAILSVPQFFNVLGLVTNDSLTVFASSGMLYFLVRALTAAPSGAPKSLQSVMSDAVGAGVFLGIGLITKGTMLTAIPVVFVALLIVGWRVASSWRKLLPAAAGMLIAFAIGGWWWLRNILVFGEIQSSNSGTGRNPESFDGYSLLEFFQIAVRQLTRTFWGSMRASLELPRWSIPVFVTVLALALVFVLVRSRGRVVIGVLSIFPLAIAGLLVFHAWEVFWNEGRIVGLQGRYFFVAITIYCLIIAYAWQALVAAAPPAVRAVGAVGAMGIAAAIGALATALVFSRRWFAGADTLGAAWDAMAASTAVGTAPVLITLAIAVLALIVAFVCGARCAAAAVAMPEGPQVNEAELQGVESVDRVSQT